MVDWFDCVWLVIVGCRLFNSFADFFGYRCWIYCDLFDVIVCLGFWVLCCYVCLLLV